MQMEMSLAKSPNKVCFNKDLQSCCLPHSLGCLLPACHDRQFRHQIVFLLHTIQHIHASQMHMISQIKCVFTKIYFNRFPKGGTSRRPLVYNSISALDEQLNDFLTVLEKEFNKEKECAIKWFS